MARQPNALAKRPSKGLETKPIQLNPNQLRMRMVPGKTEAEMMAAVAVEGVASNAMMTNVFSAGVGVGNNDLTACVDSIRDIAKRVQTGDLSDCEQILVAQTVTLNAMFAELARRAAINMGTNLDVTDRYLRLAFKAQAQSRCTADSLAEMKNPRQVTFAKQVNNANGPQQVNNGTAPAQQAEAHPTRTEETGSAPNKLLEVQDAEWVDAGTPRASAASNPAVATVAAVHRPSERSRKGHSGPKRIQGRNSRSIA